MGCAEDNSNSAKSLFVAACLKSLGNSAKIADQEKCRCIYSVADRLPDPYFASTLKEIIIEQDGNMNGIVRELAKLVQAKSAASEIDNVFEVKSIGEELQVFKEGVDACIKIDAKMRIN